ncbi:MAG TPA: hypothetical protein VHM19_01105 [Polyangiales bacterium]|nr:hypothetical protein [Polyangiales bacterium]
MISPRGYGPTIILFTVVAGLCACSASADKTGKHGQSTGNAIGSGGTGAGTGTGAAANGAVGTGSGGSASGVGNDTCASADIQTARVTPTVWLIVDGSGSMQTRFANGSRWSVLRDALMNPNGGVVPRLESAVVFGLVIYSGGQLNFGGGGGLFGGGLFGGGASDAAIAMPPADAGADSMCPVLTIVDPALNNYNNMNAVFPNTEPGGSTPTQLALDQVSMRVSAQPQMLDKDQGPTYVVLATDGQPNGCGVTGGTMGGSDPAAEQAVYDQVTKIVGTGTKLFAISLAGNDANLQAHLDQVAMLGGTGKPPFTPMNRDDLVTTFQDIIGGAGCEVKLSGKVTVGSECQGSVQINGTALTCNDPNGWKLKDEQTIQITGTACDDFRSNKQAQLHASFPCGVFIPD